MLVCFRSYLVENSNFNHLLILTLFLLTARKTALPQKQPSQEPTSSKESESVVDVNKELDPFFAPDEKPKVSFQLFVI